MIRLVALDLACMRPAGNFDLAHPIPVVIVHQGSLAVAPRLGLLPVGALLARLHDYHRRAHLVAV